MVYVKLQDLIEKLDDSNIKKELIDILNNNEFKYTDDDMMNSFYNGYAMALEE